MDKYRGFEAKCDSFFACSFRQIWGLKFADSLNRSGYTDIDFNHLMTKYVNLKFKKVKKVKFH